jgi:organic radical activating enzyme
MSDYSYFNQRLGHIKQVIDNVSPSFCAAKWTQVTIHLQTGMTHSCHHPMQHKIPLEEIKTNPSALHNTSYKKNLRAKMLNGERPRECDYCWRVEDTEGAHFSDRILKTAEEWSYPYMHKIVNAPWDDNTIPSYVEVSFGNGCNFKCGYCSPDISSKWMEEAVKYGPYNLEHTVFNNVQRLKELDRMPIPDREDNPYVDAWWQWWPELYPNLHTFRITGGEPLMNKNTFRTLDYIEANPNPNLNFAINTNLCLPDSIIDKTIAQMNRITSSKAVKKLHIYTSADTYGPHAEYIRNGMDYRQWYKNVQRIINECPDISVTIMVTFNVMSLPMFKYFLEDVAAIKNDRSIVRTDTRKHPLYVDFPYLRHPEFLSSLIASDSMKASFNECVDYIKENLGHGHKQPDHFGFYQHELHAAERIQHLLANHKLSEEQLRKNRRSFALFIEEHDKRRGTNFKVTFPELIPFLKECRNA